MDHNTNIKLFIKHEHSLSKYKNSPRQKGVAHKTATANLRFGGIEFHETKMLANAKPGVVATRKSASI